MISFLNNKENDKAGEKEMTCSDIERKKRFSKFTSITFVTIIVIFCLLVWHGYTVVANYQVDYQIGK